MTASIQTPQPRFEVNDSTNLPLAQSSQFAVRAEQLGFAGVGMPDHPHTGRDVFVRLALAATATRKVTLFPSVTNPVSRDPKMLATFAKTLDELAPGRARLVIGSGQQAVGYVEKQNATVAQMAAGTKSVINALGTQVMGETNVPVFVNASSPRMLELGGATAHGVYAVVGVDPEVVAAATHYIKAGAQSAGKNPSDVAIALGLPIFMADTKEEATESAVNYALLNLVRHTRVFSTSMRARVPALSNVAKVSDLTTAQARQLVQAMVVAGTPHEAASEVALLPERFGRDHFICRIELVGKDPIHALGRFAEAVHDLGLQTLLRHGD